MLSGNHYQHLLLSIPSIPTLIGKRMLIRRGIESTSQIKIIDLITHKEIEVDKYNNCKYIKSQKLSFFIKTKLYFD